MFALGAGTPDVRVGTGARDADAEGDDATTHPFTNANSLPIAIPDGIDVEALAIKYETVSRGLYHFIEAAPNR